MSTHSGPERRKTKKDRRENDADRRNDDRVADDFAPRRAGDKKDRRQPQ